MITGLLQLQQEMLLQLLSGKTYPPAGHVVVHRGKSIMKLKTNCSIAEK